MLRKLKWLNLSCVIQTVFVNYYYKYNCSCLRLCKIIYFKASGFKNDPIALNRDGHSCFLTNETFENERNLSWKRVLFRGKNND